MDQTQQNALFQNPLFLHPSEGPGSLSIQEKLIGAQNYRSWRRAMEIGLSTKRKLGFVKGTLTRPLDPNLAKQWDICNNMGISWIMNSVSESIVKSVMFISSAYQIWIQLEQRFALSNDSRKYKLHKDTYAIEQNGSPISEYYTKMKCVWEELDSMSELPKLNNITPELVVFLAALNKQNEEQRLFQFLNGLDDHFNSQRSQLLLNSPLPSVEAACALLQQEESQRDVLNSFANVESTALYSQRNVKDKCSICGYKWHPPEKCWEKVGYPTWHSKYKQQSQAKQQSKDYKSFKGKGVNTSVKRTAAHVDGGNVVFSKEQFDQLLKQIDKIQVTGESTDEEIDHEFVAGTAACFSCSSYNLDEWILDTGATDHMTPVSKSLVNPHVLQYKPQISLPNGHTSIISHIGNVKLKNNLLLKDVLLVPSFKFSLLSIPKLTRDSKCFAVFFENFCVI